MGRKDVHTNNYFDDNIRFADLVNGALNDGIPLVKADELCEVSKELLYTEVNKEKKIISDNAKLWKKQGVIFSLFSVENLTYTDYAAVIRCMMMEAMGYHKQWKEHNLIHRRRTDLTGSEFLSGISKTDRFYPIVPIVVYYGPDAAWDAGNTLYELLGDCLPDKLKKYVNNYKINLFDYHDYDSFEQFHTEIKTLFEFLRYSKDSSTLKNVMDKNYERYMHVDNDTGTLIKVLTNNNALEKYIENSRKSNGNKKTEGREWNMCKAFEDYRLQGKMEGKIEGTVEIVRRKYNKNMTAKEISDLLEMDLTEVEQIVEFLSLYPEEDDTCIAKRLCDKISA